MKRRWIVSNCVTHEKITSEFGKFKGQKCKIRFVAWWALNKHFINWPEGVYRRILNVGNCQYSRLAWLCSTCTSDQGQSCPAQSEKTRLPLCQVICFPSFHVGNGYTRSTKSFLYSLYNPYGYHNRKFAIRSAYYPYAIYDHANYGPTFGNGHDILTSGTSGYSYCGHSYQLPPGASYGSSCTFYTGSHSFTLSEIEVFYEEWH